MEVVELNTFKLEEYRDYNREHLNCIIPLANDPAVLKYIGNLGHFLESITLSENEIDKAYIAYFHGHAIGFIAIQMKGEYPEVSYAILEEYRHENISKILLQQFTYYLQDTYSFENIYVSINPANIPSIKTAEFVGYKKENSTRYSIKR